MFFAFCLFCLLPLLCLDIQSTYLRLFTQYSTSGTLYFYCCPWWRSFLQPAPLGVAWLWHKVYRPSISLSTAWVEHGQHEEIRNATMMILTSPRQSRPVHPIYRCPGADLVRRCRLASIQTPVVHRGPRYTSEARRQQSTKGTLNEGRSSTTGLLSTETGIGLPISCHVPKKEQGHLLARADTFSPREQPTLNDSIKSWGVYWLIVLKGRLSR